MTKNRVYNSSLLFLVFLEHLFLYIFGVNGKTGQAVNAFGFFIASFLFGVVILMKFYNKPDIKPSTQKIGKQKYMYILLYAVIIVILNIYTIRIIKIFNYLDYSDIIPAIRLLAQRLIAGKYVYSKDAWEIIYYHNVHPGYLPMHWLPIVPAEYFHFDPRTMTFVVWAIGATVLMVRSMKCDDKFLRLLIPLMILVSYHLLSHAIATVIGVTVEIMIAGYYMLFISGINQKNYLVTGLFITFCMLSRYYIFIWLPLWFFVLFVSGNRAYLFKTIGTIAALICILYIIPFVLKDYTLLTTFGESYKSTMGEWYHLNPQGLPYHLYAGNGFAYIFYEHYLHTNLEKGFLLLKKVLFVSTFGSVFVMGVWYWFKKKHINYKIFLMASFKIYLTLFLGFILVPYSYLMITSVFVSIAIFAEQARYDTDTIIERE